MSLSELYAALKEALKAEGLVVNPPREIQYGIQFLVFLGQQNGLVRVYDGKKGRRLDLSQVTDPSVADVVERVFHEVSHTTPPPRAVAVGPLVRPQSTGDPDCLIGVDESGKGDYFGPLVIAGVYVDPERTAYLRTLGVKDSKSLSEHAILMMEEKIRAACPHSVVVLNNLVYNDVYEKFPNLNQVLAWGHGRVIENLLSQVKATHALCDQFGHHTLIQSALLLRGIDIQLLQRPRAEDNMAVAAASVLARAAFLYAMAGMAETFQMVFPRGASAAVKAAREQFLAQFGQERLVNVAKCHFKLR